MPPATIAPFLLKVNTDSTPRFFGHCNVSSLRQSSGNKEINKDQFSEGNGSKTIVCIP